MSASLLAGATLLGHPRPAFGQAPPPMPNLVQNGSFELAAPGAPANAPTNELGFGDPNPANPLVSEVANWQQATHAHTHWYRAGAADPDYSVPINEASQSCSPGATQPTRSGNGYAGIAMCNMPLNGSAQHRGYISQLLPAPLSAGHYYIELFSKQARKNRHQIRASDTNFGLHLTAPPLTTTPTAAGIGTFTPTVWQKDVTFNSTDDWSRTAGYVQAAGGEQVVTIGNFAFSSQYQTTSGCSTQSVYLLDDIGIYVLPVATVSLAATGCQYRLAPSGLLPPSSNATYTWRSSAGGPALPSADGITALVPATQAGTYWLDVTIPSPNPAQPAYPPVTTAVVVQAQPQAAASAGGPYTVFNTAGQTLAGSGLPTTGTGVWSVQTPNGLFPLAIGGAAGFVSTLTGELPPGITPGAYTVCYTYTSPKSPPGCVTNQACTTLTVLPYHCALTGVQPDFVWAPDPPGSTSLTLDGTVVSTDLAVGVYHVTCPVTLTNGTFTTKPGTVFLFDAGTSLTVASETGLRAQGTRFTAACAQMWDALYIEPGSYGVYIGEDNGGLYEPLPSVKAYGGAFQQSEFSHSAGGIQWADPHGSPLRLVATHFYNNIFNVKAGKYSNAADHPVHGRSAVVNCVFDADPLYFKRDPRGVLRADRLPLSHLDLDGWNYNDPIIPIAGNLVADALLGLAANPSGDPFSLTLGETNLFQGNRVMGIGVHGLTRSFTIGAASLTRVELPAPTAALRPSQATLDELTAAYPWLTPLVGTTAATAPCWGVYVGETHYGPPPPNAPSLLTLDGLEIAPSAGSPPLGSATLTQTGIEIKRGIIRYRVCDNKFTNLSVGLRIGLESTGAQCEVAGNTIENCRVSMAVRNAYWHLPAFSAPIIWPRCNTFLRTAGTGDNSGIQVEPPTDPLQTKLPVFDDYARNSSGRPYQVVMKNRFENSTTGHFLYLHNTAGGRVPYTAYQSIIQNPPCSGCIVQLQAEFQMPTNSSGFDIILDRSSARTWEYKPGMGCQDEMPPFDAGFQRSAIQGAAPQLANQVGVAPSYPNPAIETTDIAYAVPGARQAELLVREVVRGNVVRRQALAVDGRAATLSVVGLVPGVYTYSVVADGVVIGTRKLVVGR